MNGYLKFIIFEDTKVIVSCDLMKKNIKNFERSHYL